MNLIKNPALPHIAMGFIVGALVYVLVFVGLSAIGQPADGGVPADAVVALAEAPAVAPAVGEKPGMDWLGMLVKAMTSGQWKLVAGLLLVGLVWPLRSGLAMKLPWFKTKLGGVLVASVAAFAATLGPALVAGVPMSVALVSSAGANMLASGGAWHLLSDWLQYKAKQKAPA